MRIEKKLILNNLEFLKLSDISVSKINSITNEIQNIFFLNSTRKNFESENEKLSFFKNWTDYYLLEEPEFTYLCLSNNKLVGYLTGCVDSTKALNFFETRIPYYQLFSEYFNQFPSHLHINIHPEYQGHSIGSKLIIQFEKQIKTKSPGLHIVTSVHSRNVNFYQRLGFSFKVIKQYNHSDLLFMGKQF